MTVTEAVSSDAPASSPPSAAPAPRGVAALLGSGDHKVVGRAWIVVAFVELVLAGIAGAAVSLERVDTADASDVLSLDVLGQVFSFHAVVGTFGVVLPLVLGLATVVVPLQVGARTLAFPRAAAAAFWAFLVGSGLLLGAYLIDGGPFGGDVDGVLLFVAALTLVLVAQAVAWICVVVTVATLRAPGLGLIRVPLFSWSALVAGVVWLITLPVLVALLVLTYLDLRYGPVLGGDVALYDRVAWAFGQPTVLAFGIPVLGVAGAVVPVFARTRHRQHRVAAGLIAAYGALTVGVWALPAVADGARPWLYDAPWVAVSFAAVLPVAALCGLWADTLRRGRVTPASPLLFGLAAAVMLLVGVLAAAVSAVEPLETLVDGEGSSLYGTTWTTSVAHYVTVAAVLALLGGLVFWAPKVLGRSVAEGPARALALVALLATIALAFPDLVSGLLGQAARLGTPADNQGAIEALNVVSAVGGGLLIVVALAFVALVVRALASSERPADDPWEGHTLEWATSSPPPSDNFTTVPEITSEAPLYDARSGEEVPAR